MNSDEDMMAQIANIEAQLNYTQQTLNAQPQPSAFGGSTFGQLPAQQQGFPRQATAPQQPHGGAAAGQAPHQFSKDSDDRSVFVGNLPRGGAGAPVTTPEELAQFFQDCGPIMTCTVLRDKATGELKGTAYVEFATHEAAGRAIDTKNNANFKGSTIVVTKKRSLFRPGMTRGGPPTMRGGRGRGGFQPDPMQAMMALMAMSAGMTQFMGGRGGRGRGGRGRGMGGQNEGGFQPFQ